MTGIISNKKIRINLTGYGIPFIQDSPTVIKLPMLDGYFVPVFKELSVLEDAMRYLKVTKYRVEYVGNTEKFYEMVTSAGTKIVINPKAYNGVTIWDGVLPQEENLIT